MKNNYTKNSLKLMLAAVLLAGAYRAGVTSGDLVVAELAREVERCPKPLFLQSEWVDLRVRAVRLYLIRAVREAEFAQLTGDASRTVGLPAERLQALQDRLHAPRRPFRALKAV